MFSDKKMIDFEKETVFLSNIILVIMMIFTFLYGIEIKYFFYFNIVFTFILAYIFFKRSKEVSRILILTNMFIFFYFSYPLVSEFLFEWVGSSSYLMVLFYTIFVAYIFLVFSGYQRVFFGDIKKFNLKIVLVIALIGVVFGLLFYSVHEPVPVPTLFDPQESGYFETILIFTLVLAFAEQIMFSGFLFNSYKNLTNKRDAFMQVGTMFVFFHLLRFEQLVGNYYVRFESLFLFYIITYYVLLFIFIIVALYFYSNESEKYTGNFFYPVMLHFVTDFTLFTLIYFFGL